MNAMIFNNQTKTYIPVEVHSAPESINNLLSSNSFFPVVVGNKLFEASYSSAFDALICTYEYTEETIALRLQDRIDEIYKLHASKAREDCRRLIRQIVKDFEPFT